MSLLGANAGRYEVFSKRPATWRGDARKILASKIDMVDVDSLHRLSTPPNLKIGLIPDAPRELRATVRQLASKGSERRCLVRSRSFAVTPREVLRA